MFPDVPEIADSPESAAVIPDQLRSRVSGAFHAVNYGTRPLGALAGGLLGTLIGMRATLWIAAIGGVIGFLLLLPTPLPRFRMPADRAPGTAATALSPASAVPERRPRRVLPRHRSGASRARRQV